MNLWLAVAYRNERWSVFGQIGKLQSMLVHVHLPSTTTRRPRPIAKFSKYKGNELRSLLLFAYPIFESVLERRYYCHFLLLVLIMHLSESRSLCCDEVENLQHLCTEFVLIFPRLYSARHNVQVIHSIIHLPDSVKGFGPVSNYTTFNFESLLGMH